MEQLHKMMNYLSCFRYDNKEERIIFLLKDESVEAKRLYEEIVKEYFCDENSIWCFDIALDCVCNMSEKDLSYIREHPQLTEYHFGYGMWIRNNYIHCSRKHDFMMADNISSEVLRYIFSIVIPYYDFNNRGLVGYLEDYRYPNLREDYGEEYPDVFESVLSYAIDEGRNLSGEDMMYLLKTALLKRTGMDYYGYILVKCLREAEIRDLNVIEYKEKRDNLARIMDKHSTMFELQKRQVLALLDAGIIFKLDLYTKKIKSISEISDIIIELLNFDIDDARLLAVYFYRISGYIIRNRAKS